MRVAELLALMMGECTGTRDYYDRVAGELGSMYISRRGHWSIYNESKARAH